MLVWMEYNCTVSGGTYKFVECEECKQKYVYRMVREAKGQGNSLFFLDNTGAQGRAQNSAQAELQKALSTDCDAVPCPECGTYQENMIAKICREYRLWLYWVGVFAIFAGVVCAAFGYAYHETESRSVGFALWLLAFVGIVGGIGAIVGRRQMAAKYEPNAEPLEDRLALAARRAEKVKNFKRWLEEQGVDVDDVTMS